MKKKKWIIIIIAIVVVAACAAGIIAVKVQKLNAFMDTFQLYEADLTAVADGTYTGEADAGIIQVIAEVTVRNHTLTDITLLKHVNGQGADAESITGRMVAEQKIGVDTVSGATLSSKVIQKAVENALSGGETNEVSNE